MSEAAKKPVILAVDDATDLLALMAKALSADYEVITASDEMLSTLTRLR